MRAEDYIEDLVAQGRHHFTTCEVLAAVQGTDSAVRAQLRRLKRRGRIASPLRSFHVVVSPKYRRRGCPPAEHFIDQLMEELGEAYYVALLSAAQRHGAAHQSPQLLQVMVRKNRPSIQCGLERIVFIARRELDRMPVNIINTSRGVLRYSSPEVTALELVGYPRHAGGINNVATILSDLAEEMEAAKLLKVAQMSPVGWSQRLGYLLELVEQQELADALATFVSRRARSYTPLRRAQGVLGAERNARWKLIINVTVDPDE